MPAVVLVDRDGTEHTVSTLLGLQHALFRNGMRPDTGTVAQAVATVANGQPVPAALQRLLEEFPEPSGDSGELPAEVSHPLTLRSSAAGGENTSDSTSRLTVESYQRAQYTNDSGTDTNAHYGEGVRLDLMQARAKNMIAWRDGFSNPADPKSVAWVGAHNLANDEGVPPHRHISIETVDASGQNIVTRLEVTYGQDAAVVRVVNADFVVHSGSGKAVINGTGEKQLTFGVKYKDDPWQEPDPTGYRWQVKTDGTTESGGNAGSDFRVTRFQDSGAVANSPLFIKRSTGNVGLGGAQTVANPEQILHVESSATVTPILARTTQAAATQPAIMAETKDASGFLFGGQITGDTVQRFRIDPSGRISWGSGAAARDVVLYRNAAGVLKTDGEFHTAANLRVGTGQMGGGAGGVVGVGNAPTPPTTNPTSGGVLYAEGGALKWRGSNGTVTTIAPA